MSQRKVEPPKGLPDIKSSELAAGDLIFLARPSPLQALCGFVGDPWRHLGFICEAEDGLVVFEFAQRGFQVRSLGQVLNYYTSVGVARLPDRMRLQLLDEIVTSARRGALEARFSWVQVICTGLLALSQRAGFGMSALGWAFTRGRLGRLIGAPSTHTCSSFATAVLVGAGVVKLAGGRQHVRVVETDTLPLPAELVSPGDIWRLSVFASRAYVGQENNTRRRREDRWGTGRLSVGSSSTHR